MPEPDMSNNKLSKIFTVEMLWVVSVTLVTVTLSWGALANGQSEQDKKILSLEGQQSSMLHTLTKVQTDTAVIRNEQKHMSKRQEEDRKDIKRILEILLKHNSGTP